MQTGGRRGSAGSAFPFCLLPLRAPAKRSRATLIGRPRPGAKPLHGRCGVPIRVLATAAGRYCPGRVTRRYRRCDDSVTICRSRNLTGGGRRSTVSSEESDGGGPVKRRVVLIVAQDAGLRARMARSLGAAGYAVELAGTPRRAGEVLAAGGIRVVIVVPDGFGPVADLIEEARAAVGPV